MGGKIGDDGRESISWIKLYCNVHICRKDYTRNTQQSHQRGFIAQSVENDELNML
ncbi:MAG: hypothetical protein ACKPKO_22725 [Candidatus Fonsibacter sp.]